MKFIKMNKKYIFLCNTVLWILIFSLCNNYSAGPIIDDFHNNNDIA